MLALRIALRYLVSKKSHSAVNIISAISMAAVAVATAAMVIILSVFNGFADLAASHYSRIDPPLMVSLASGRPIEQADSLARRLAVLPEVAEAMPSITERGLVMAGDRQVAVVFKGVTDAYNRIVSIDSVVIDGHFATSLATGEVPAALTVGVASHTGLRPGMEGAALYVPRRIGRINPANPAGAFLALPFTPTAVVQIDQLDFDADHIFIPLDRARDILLYDNAEATDIEVLPAAGVSADKAAEAISASLGDAFTVADRHMQQGESFRMIAIEKWVTFAMLIFILIIATFNIISTLSLLVIEKRPNIHTLRAMGAPKRLIRRIFMAQGALITTIGGIVGCVLGIALSLAQQYGGFIRLSGDPSMMTITTYPVRVLPADVVVVLAIVMAIAAATSFISRFFTRKEL